MRRNAQSVSGSVAERGARRREVQWGPQRPSGWQAAKLPMGQTPHQGLPGKRGEGAEASRQKEHQ